MLRDIYIKSVLNGFIVTIGCQTLVFNKRKKLLRELDRYLQDPNSVVKHYMTKSINAGKVEPGLNPHPAQENALRNYGSALRNLSMSQQDQVRQLNQDGAPVPPLPTRDRGDTDPASP